MAEYITKANFSTEVDGLELYYHGSGGGQGSWKFYMLAPCWHVHVKYEKAWGSWGRDTTLNVWVFNGEVFDLVYTITHERGQFDSGTYHIHWYHNWPGQSSSGDRPNLHLYRVEVVFGERYDKYINIEYGSYASSNQDWADKKIYGACPVGLEYLWLQNGDWQDEMAKSAGQTSRRRGTRIGHANERACCYTDDHNR